MQKVLSTKLKVDELDRFTAMAKQQGESKAGLLKRLVLDYMNSGGKLDRAESIGRPHPAASSKKDLPLDKTNNSHGLSYCTSPSSCKPLSSEALRSKGLVSIHRQWHTVSPTPAPVTIGLPGIANEGYRLDSLLSSKESLSVYQNESKGRPEASTRSSTGNGWLLFLILLALWLKSQPSITVDRETAFTTQPPQVDEHGLYTFRVGNTVVYSSSPIPFW